MTTRSWMIFRSVKSQAIAIFSLKRAYITRTPKYRHTLGLMFTELASVLVRKKFYFSIFPKITSYRLVVRRVKIIYPSVLC